MSAAAASTALPPPGRGHAAYIPPDAWSLRRTFPAPLLVVGSVAGCLSSGAPAMQVTTGGKL
jgi:hypothetical protein